MSQKEKRRKKQKQILKVFIISIVHLLKYLVGNIYQLTSLIKEYKLQFDQLFKPIS
jgi:hypothetical protein